MTLRPLRLAVVASIASLQELDLGSLRDADYLGVPAHLELHGYGAGPRPSLPLWSAGTRNVSHHPNSLIAEHAAWSSASDDELLVVFHGPSPRASRRVGGSAAIGSGGCLNSRSRASERSRAVQLLSCV